MEKITVSPSNIAEGMFSVNTSPLIGYDICFSDETQARMVAATIDKIREKDAKDATQRVRAEDLELAQNFLSKIP